MYRPVARPVTLGWVTRTARDLCPAAGDPLHAVIGDTFRARHRGPGAADPTAPARPGCGPGRVLEHRSGMERVSAHLTRQRTLRTRPAVGHRSACRVPRTPA